MRSAKAGASAKAGKAGEAATLHERELEVDVGDSSENKVSRLCCLTPDGGQAGAPGICSPVAPQVTGWVLHAAVARVGYG